MGVLQARRASQGPPCWRADDTRRKRRPVRGRSHSDGPFPNQSGRPYQRIKVLNLIPVPYRGTASTTAQSLLSLRTESLSSFFLYLVSGPIRACPLATTVLTRRRALPSLPLPRCLLISAWRPPSCNHKPPSPPKMRAESVAY